jgi:hypothetical protein
MNFKSNNLCIILEAIDATFRSQLEELATLAEAKLVMKLLAKLYVTFQYPTEAIAHTSVLVCHLLSAIVVLCNFAHKAAQFPPGRWEA